MNNESIKQLSEADKIASERIQSARRDREKLRQRTKQEAAEFEANLLKMKDTFVKEYREKSEKYISDFEEKIKALIDEAVEQTKANESYYEIIAEEAKELVITNGERRGA